MKRIVSAIAAAGLVLFAAGCGEIPAEPQQNAASEPESALEVITKDDVSGGAETSLPEDTTEPEQSAAETTSADTDYDAGTLTETEPLSVEVIDRNGTYTTKEDVALYIYTYGELPQNFITKKEAQALGWEGGSLEPYAPGCCIGGSYFGNYEGNLPEKEGREYIECDIDTLGQKSRGAKRIVFSNDGLIYYTEDHYNTFELLYGEE